MPEHLQSREGSCPSAPPAPPLDLARTGSRYPAQTTPTPSRDPSSSCHSSACLGLSSTALIRSLPSTRQALKIKVGPEAGPGLEGPLGLTGLPLLLLMTPAEQSLKGSFQTRRQNEVWVK